jgi:hypothetical protein
VERTLALICGAGPLPARIGVRARRAGWRILALTFGDAEGVQAFADRVVPSRVTELGPVLAALQEDRVTAALFAGKFWMREVIGADRARADSTAVSVAARARSRSAANLSRAVISTLESLGIAVHDPRGFMGDWLAEAGCLTPRVPTDDEWRDVRAGLDVARALAGQDVGQTVVMHHGVVTAVEAVEGTTAAIERGTALAGPGAVIVKAVAADHDYRLDLPAVGSETIASAARGEAAVLAIQAGRVALIDREQALAEAAAAGLTVVSVDDAWPPPS